MNRTKLAEELKALADYVLTSKDGDVPAEVGIRLAELRAEWERVNFGLTDELIACREAGPLALAV